MANEGYNRNLDKSEKIEGINVGKEKGERFLNVEVYSYDGGTKKVRILPVNRNTNPNCDPNKKWLKQKAISSITKEEAKELIKALEKALIKLR